jgi:preprotein translocase subunit YajC
MNNLILLQAAAPTGSNNYTLFLLAGMILVFYFFMIKPQQKKAKDAKKFQENIQKGDKVVTIAGIHGTINKVNEDGTISLEVNPGSYLRMEKSAISIEWSQQANKASLAASEKKP